MQQAINIKVASIIAGLALAFGLALPALAYSDLEVEIDIYTDGAKASVSYIDSEDDEVDEEYTFSTTSEADIIDEIVADLNDDEITVEVVTAAADVENHDEGISDDDDDSENEEGDDNDDSDDSDFCTKTGNAAGWGVAKKCVDSEDYTINDKLATKIDRFADFGKTTDHAELQSQLRELLTVLIQLLQQQIAQQSS